MQVPSNIKPSFPRVLLTNNSRHTYLYETQQKPQKNSSTEPTAFFQVSGLKHFSSGAELSEVKEKLFDGQKLQDEAGWTMSRDHFVAVSCFLLLDWTK